MTYLRQDLRFAARSPMKRRGLSAVQAPAAVDLALALEDEPS
jgi:hypothetical protein